MPGGAVSKESSLGLAALLRCHIQVCKSQIGNCRPPWPKGRVMDGKWYHRA